MILAAVVLLPEEAKRLPEELAGPATTWTTCGSSPRGGRSSQHGSAAPRCRTTPVRRMPYLKHRYQQGYETHDRDRSQGSAPWATSIWEQARSRPVLGSRQVVPTIDTSEIGR
jgi:hypothetical protein